MLNSEVARFAPKCCASSRNASFCKIWFFFIITLFNCFVKKLSDYTKTIAYELRQIMNLVISQLFGI